MLINFEKFIEVFDQKVSPEEMQFVTRQLSPNCTDKELEQAATISVTRLGLLRTLLTLLKKNENLAISEAVLVVAFEGLTFDADGQPIIPVDPEADAPESESIILL